MSIKPVKKAIGMAFKKDQKAVLEALEGLSDEEALAIKVRPPHTHTFLFSQAQAASLIKPHSATICHLSFISLVNCFSDEALAIKVRPCMELPVSCSLRL